MSCHYTQLEQDALLHITGPDSLKFLQGQTTCDTRLIDAAHALPGAFCTAQGRVICDFLLFELGADHFALRMRRDIRASSAAAFGKYIIFSKAQLDAAREDWRIIAVWGSDAANTLRDIFSTLPTERFGAVRGADFVLVQTDERGEAFECFMRQPADQAWLAKFGAKMSPGSEAAWQVLQITSGIARIEAATVEAFVPQVLNYDLTGHISFRKGCYTGQEVVARLHYRGKTKRRSHVATLPATEPVVAGAELFDAESAQSVGHVVNVARSGEVHHALVAATFDGVTKGLRLGGADGPLLSMGELPYSLERD